MAYGLTIEERQKSAMLRSFSATGADWSKSDEGKQASAPLNSTNGAKTPFQSNQATGATLEQTGADWSSGGPVLHSQGYPLMGYSLMRTGAAPGYLAGLEQTGLDQFTKVNPVGGSVR